MISIMYINVITIVFTTGICTLTIVVVEFVAVELRPDDRGSGTHTARASPRSIMAWTFFVNRCLGFGSISGVGSGVGFGVGSSVGSGVAFGADLGVGSGLISALGSAWFPA